MVSEIEFIKFTMTGEAGSVQLDQKAKRSHL